MAKKNQPIDEPQNGREDVPATPPATEATAEPVKSSPIRLLRVRFMGGEKLPALAVFNREPLPEIGADGTFELERTRARSLVRYWPDRYQIVRGE